MCLVPPLRPTATRAPRVLPHRLHDVGMEVRRATAFDADAVNSVMQKVYIGEGWADPDRSPQYVADLQDGLRRIENATVFVAEDHGVTVGTVTATLPRSPYANIAQGAELEVHMLAVLPAIRGRGGGAALMRACREMAGEAGADRVVLSTDPDMHEAHRLYARLGYVRTPLRDWSVHGFRLITFALDLTSG